MTIINSLILLISFFIVKQTEDAVDCSGSGSSYRCDGFYVGIHNETFMLFITVLALAAIITIFVIISQKSKAGNNKFLQSFVTVVVEILTIAYFLMAHYSFIDQSTNGSTMAEAESNFYALIDGNLRTYTIPVIIVLIGLLAIILISGPLSKRQDEKINELKAQELKRTRSERSQRFENIIRRSESLEIRQLSELLELPEKDLLMWLYDLPETYGFTISQNIVKFTQDDIETNIDSLLASFEQMEAKKVGKIE